MPKKSEYNTNLRGTATIMYYKINILKMSNCLKGWMEVVTSQQMATFIRHYVYSVCIAHKIYYRFNTIIPTPNEETGAQK